MNDESIFALQRRNARQLWQGVSHLRANRSVIAILNSILNKERTDFEFKTAKLRSFVFEGIMLGGFCPVAWYDSYIWFSTDPGWPQWVPVVGKWARWCNLQAQPFCTFLNSSCFFLLCKSCPMFTLSGWTENWSPLPLVNFSLQLGNKAVEMQFSCVTMYIPENATTEEDTTHLSIALHCQKQRDKFSSFSLGLEVSKQFQEYTLLRVRESSGKTQDCRDTLFKHLESCTCDAKTKQGKFSCILQKG